MIGQDEEARRGAAVYSKRVLGLYDVLVVYLSNTFVWRCGRDRMTERYNQNLSARHLDVGPGTGWYLANACLPSDATVTLLDLNTNSLASASARLGDATTRTVVAETATTTPKGSNAFSHDTSPT